MIPVAQTELPGAAFHAEVARLGRPPVGVIVAWEKQLYGKFPARLFCLLPVDERVILPSGPISARLSDLVPRADLSRFSPADFPEVPISQVPHQGTCLLPVLVFLKGAYGTTGQEAFLLSTMKESAAPGADAARAARGCHMEPARELLIVVARKGVAFAASEGGHG